VNASEFAADIAHRARLAREHNDGHPYPAWSTGERLAVALVLDDDETLEAEGYTREQAGQRIGGDLEFYGYGAGVETWIADIREAL
jgi:hypothetical protein